ncbi:MAG TPA: hypothetical protein VFR78_09795 [Pyrinomonadaceae bacterium]|nr:hypothetical protein [Pyrinomonadaceae bacterium]
MAQIFENFEVNRDRRWGVVLTKLVGASLVLHLVLLWLVIYVPSVRDTVNIAAIIANTTFVDKDYQATQIGDEVQVVQLEKFRYPDGYFALENQIASGQPAAAATPDPFAPKIISQASQQRDIPDPAASPSPTPVASASPAASPGASASPAEAIAQASPSASPSATALTPEEAQKKLEETAAKSDVSLPDENQINKKVLKDFAAYANDLKNQGKLDLNKPFEIVIEAELDENGKLKNPRFTQKTGDTNLVELFGKMVAALNDSGLLIYLKAISQDNPGATVKFTIRQGEREVLASIESEASSPNSAVKLAGGLNGSLALGAIVRSGKDEAELMKNTKVTPDGKKVVVNFSMPRQTVLDMIKKQMATSGA